MANQNLSQFTEKLFVADADHTFIWDTAASISKRVSRNSWLSGTTANCRLGLADAAAPVAQTLSVQSVVAGTTNTAGAVFTIDGSQGTGTGAGGALLFRTAAAGTSGSTVNALGTRMAITSAGNVGIGTTIPTANFEVVGGLTNTVIIGNHTNNSTSASLTFRGKTGGGINLSAVWMMRADANFQLDTYASTAAIRVDASTGRVAFANGIEGETFLTGRIAIGNSISADENEGLLVVKKGYNNATGNHHCIRVTAADSVLAAAAGINFFDSQGTVSSANNIDHIADFQARSARTGTGTMNDWHGFYTAPVINSTGTTTRVAHFEVTNAGGTGAIGTQYGIKIASLTRGSTANYAVFTAGTTPSLFGGDVEVGTSANGIILKSPDGTRYRITVPNGGASLTITAV